MYTHKSFIQRSDMTDDSGVFAKSRSLDDFAKDFSGLAPIKKEEEEELSSPDAVTSEEDKKPVTAAAPIETSDLTDDVAAAANWLSDDEDENTDAPVKSAPVSASNDTPDYDAIKQKADKYEQLTQSEIFKLVDAFAASGKKDISEFVKEVAGDDINKKSFEEIYDIHLRNMGISEESREKLLEKFEREDFEDQEVLIAPIKQQLVRDRDDKLNAFLNSYQSVASPQNQKVSEAEQARLNALVEQGRGQVKDIVTGMVDKKWNGLYVSKEMAAELEQNILENPCPIVKDGMVVGYDLKKATRIAIASNEKYLKNLIKANIEMAKTVGWDEFVNKRNKPSKENTATPQSAVNKSKSQVIGQYSDDAYGTGLSQPKFE